MDDDDKKKKKAGTKAKAKATSSAKPKAASSAKPKAGSSAKPKAGAKPKAASSAKPKGTSKPKAGGKGKPKSKAGKKPKLNAEAAARKERIDRILSRLHNDDDDDDDDPGGTGVRDSTDQMLTGPPIPGVVRPPASVDTPPKRHRMRNYFLLFLVIAGIVVAIAFIPPSNPPVPPPEPSQGPTPSQPPPPEPSSEPEPPTEWIGAKYIYYIFLSILALIAFISFIVTVFGLRGFFRARSVAKAEKAERTLDEEAKAELEGEVEEVYREGRKYGVTREQARSLVVSKRNKEFLRIMANRDVDPVEEEAETIPTDDLADNVPVPFNPEELEQEQKPRGRWGRAVERFTKHKGKFLDRFLGEEYEEPRELTLEERFENLRR